MKKSQLLVNALTICCVLLTGLNPAKSSSFNADEAWQELANVVKHQYAYIDRPTFNVQALFDEFEARAVKTTTKQAFADTAQMFLRHFYDPHLNLGPYNEHDFSVFPTGSDIRATMQHHLFVIEDVKAGSAADIAGIRPGAELLSINNLPVKASIERVFGQSFNQLSPEQITYGLNISLGGLRNSARIIALKQDGKLITQHLAASYDAINALANGPTITVKKLENVGYIRFNNSLGNTNTVKAFKQAVNALLNTNALILDLRNTPSGGNTGVAEPILGHFVDKLTAYQLYQIQTENRPYTQARMETAYVKPNAPHYTKPVVVLAGRWTGSMGEGMTIGLDAIGAKAVVGAPMADLLGGIKTVKLRQSDTWIEFGFERLYHVNNTYREDFEPNVLVIPADRDEQGNDPALLMALDIIQTDAGAANDPL